MSHADPFDISASASMRNGDPAFNQKPPSRAASSSSRPQGWVACGQEAEAPRMAIDLGPLSRPEVVINAGSAPTTAGSSELSTGPSLSAATATTNAATAAPTVTVVYAAPPTAAAAPPVAPSKTKKANALSALCRPAANTEDEEMAFVAESDTDAAKAAKKRNGGICVPLRGDDADDMLATTSRSQPDGAGHTEAAKEKTTSKRFPCITLDADADENKQQRSEEGAQVQDGAAASRSCFSATFEGTRAVGSGAGNDANSDVCAEPPKERTARHRFSAPALCGAPVVPAATATAVATGDAVEGGDAASTTDDLDEAAELRQLQAEQDDPFFCCCGEDIARKDPRLLKSGEKLQTASSTGWIGNPGFGAGGCRAWCSRLHWPSAVYLALMTLASFFVTIGIVFPVYQTKAYTASRAAPHEVWTLWMHCTETRLGNAGSLVGQAQGGTHCHTWPEDKWECSDIKSRYNAARVFGVILILVSLGSIIAGVTHALRIYRFPAGPILLLIASFILTIFTLAATTSIWQINTCDSGARANDPNLRIGEAPYFYMTALLLQVVAVPFVVYMLYFPSARLRGHRDEVDPERGAFTALEQQRRDELKREFPGLINEDVVGREVRVGDYVRQLAAADYVTSAPPTALSVAALGATAPEVLSARDAQPTTRRESAARTAPTPITSRYVAASPAAAAADAPTSGRPPMPGFSGVVPASATTPQQQLRVL